MRISIVIPVLNEVERMVPALAALQPWRQVGDEVLVVDGGSRDGTRQRALAWADRVLEAAPGRARQMNAGALAATGDLLLFLHVDTRLPGGARDRILSACAGGSPVWGRFDVRLSGRHPLLRLIERGMNWRSAWTGIATGDQAIFMHQSLFRTIGGYAPIPLMEDVDISRRLSARVRPARIKDPVVSDSRRWERDGILRTVLLMWHLRWDYWRGENPSELATRYYPAGSGE